MRLQQVIWNLLSNAVKFTRAGEAKPIQVSTRAMGAEMEIEVADPGEGLDPAFIPHLFGRFRQGDPGFSRRHGGLGLGLALVKQLIEMHGGEVRASSTGVGKGATFTVRLPRHNADTGDVPASANKSPPLESTLGGIRVLAVEDQPTMLEYLQHVLEEHGAEVLTANSADAALKMLKERGSSIDVLISDIGMPELDGYQLIRIVRQTLRIPPQMLPALALTAFAREEDHARAVLHGYQAHMSKPYQVPQLLTTLRELVSAAKTRPL
jgi:CheY-like chemotaxis protein